MTKTTAPHTTGPPLKGVGLYDYPEDLGGGGGGGWTGVGGHTLPSFVSVTILSILYENEAVTPVFT